MLDYYDHLGWFKDGFYDAIASRNKCLFNYILERVMFSTLSPTDAAASTMLIMMGSEFNLYGCFVLTSCWLNCFSFLVPNWFFFVLQEPSLLSFH